MLKGDLLRVAEFIEKTVPRKKPNVTICFAVSREGLLHYLVIQDGMKTEIFKSYLKFYMETISLTNRTVLMEFELLTMLPGTEESKISTLVEDSL